MMRQEYYLSKKWMNDNKYDYYDEFLDKDYTKIAEDCAIAMDHDEWLDDETHWIWDLALDILDRIDNV